VNPIPGICRVFFYPFALLFLFSALPFSGPCSKPGMPALRNDKKLDKKYDYFR
jgi:hypothetical protein